MDEVSGKLGFQLENPISKAESLSPDTSEKAAIIPVESTTYDSLNTSSYEITKTKTPKRILHFSDGILEEYSTDEDEKTEVDGKKNQSLIDPTSMPWLPFFWYYVISLGTKTINVCDYLGENLAWFFGITSPKYQYEIDEYNWQQKQDEEKKKKDEELMHGWKDPDNNDVLNMQQKSLSTDVKSTEWSSS